MNRDRTPHQEVHYFGQVTNLDRIQNGLAELRGSASFNIVGTVGAGKTGLLNYIQQQLTRSEEAWLIRQGSSVEVIRLDGKNFVKERSFIEFFIEGLDLHFGSRWDHIQQSAGVDSLADPLAITQIFRWVTRNDLSLVIMIDNFANIMERLSEAEAMKLNYLKHPYVNYILVTDHRSVAEINNLAFSASTFFKDIIELHLSPIGYREADQFIQRECESLGADCVASSCDWSLIHQLGGGHPGLLKELVRLCSHRKRLRQIDGGWDTRPLNDANRSILRFLPQEDLVRDYLSKIADSLTSLTPSEQELLVEIAMGWFGTEKSTVSHLYNPAMRLRFLVRGLIDTENVLQPVISSQLIQFTILQNLTNVKFSEAEEIVFNLLRRKRPGLASFEDLDAALNTFMPPEKAGSGRDPRRRFIDSTMIRVRKKLEEASNRAAFALENERGRGFYMYSQVTFDEFYEQGPEVFKEMKGPTKS